MFGDAPPFGDAPAPLDEAGSNPFPWLNGNGNGRGNGEEPAESLESAGDVDPDDPPQGDRSLRYRLAQSAARKKGLSDIEPSS
jgi:hypothetical protein